MKDYNELIESLSNKKRYYSFFLIDGRVYIKDERYKLFEFIDSYFISHVLKGGDIIKYEDTEYCEEVVQIPNNETLWHYIMKGQLK